MTLFQRFFANCRKPEGWMGRLILNLMNHGHNKGALWALSHLQLTPNTRILDIGCGGGRNIANLLARAPQGEVRGVDYSAESVEKSRDFNRKAIATGQVEVYQAEVSRLPFEDDYFDLVTAFETIYFWPQIIADFTEVRRVLKSAGQFMVFNEACTQATFEKWQRKIVLNGYSRDDLLALFQKAGFINIDCDVHANGDWICVIGRTP